MLAGLCLLLAKPEVISPYDRRIVYVGRFDTRDPYGPKGAWPAVEARVEVKGAGIQVRIQDSGPDWLQVELDGRPTQAVQLQPGVQTIEVMAPKPGTHTYAFIKRTEPFVGTLQFLGFEPEDGRVLPAHRRKRNIEVIGDAIACGCENEAADGKEEFRPATEDVYLSYASIAARLVGADVEILAWSDRKMWPDNTISSIYDLNIPTDPETPYDFRGEAPEAIVIHLGTTDFAKENPDEGEWVGAYKGFIARLRGHYPKAAIYVVLGGKLNDSDPPGHKALSTARVYLTRMVAALQTGGDKRVHFLEFDRQREEEGLGAGGYPSVAMHEKMAARLVAALKHDLRW